jgi:cytochrome c553
MNRNLVLSILCLLAAAVVTQAADAKATWDKDCAKCHGANGNGDTRMGKRLGVKDYTDAKVQASLKDEEMVKAIKDGVKEGGRTKMKAFTSLSDADVKALVAHIRSFKK